MLRKLTLAYKEQACKRGNSPFRVKMTKKSTKRKEVELILSGEYTFVGALNPKINDKKDLLYDDHMKSLSSRGCCGDESSPHWHCTRPKGHNGLHERKKYGKSYARW